MALTQKQKAAIQSQLKKNIAKRSATQRTKISDSEARTVSNKMNKRPGAMKGFTLKDSSLLSKNERNTLGATSKANAAKEKFIQKNRSFAKGEGKLAVKNRVGTKSEYKQLGKDIEMRKQLIARGKVARASQAARAAAKSASAPIPTKTTTLTKPKASTTAIKSRTIPNTKMSGTVKVTDKRSPVEKKMSGKAALKEVKKNTPKNSNRVTDSPKISKLQTLDQAKASAPKPMMGPRKPTAEEFKTTMSKAPSNAPLKPSSKIASKVNDAKKAVTSTKVGNTIKAASKTTAAKSATSAGKKVVKAVTPGPVKKFVGKAAIKGLQVFQAGKEAKQIVSGQAEKDFRRIQALENRIAVAKGQKPKYTTTGTNKNLVSSVKTDLGVAAKILSGGIVGKDRKDRLAELKAKATKVGARTPGPKGGAVSKPPQGKKPVLTKGSNTPTPTSGNKYRVNSGDTLSGIASRAGVSLKDLRSANPQITDPRKIYRNTGVVIPKSGKVPTGGYTKKAK